MQPVLSEPKTPTASAVWVQHWIVIRCFDLVAEQYLATDPFLMPPPELTRAIFAQPLDNATATFLMPPLKLTWAPCAQPLKEAMVSDIRLQPLPCLLYQLQRQRAHHDFTW